jgi:glycosyltransferase involved in cell wall biosynthesis
MARASKTKVWLQASSQIELAEVVVFSVGTIMHCILAQDNRFVLNQGRPASFNTFYERFGQRYLDVFDSVTLVGRLFPIEDPTARPVEGPGVKFFPMPAYLGPVQYLFKRTAIAARACEIYSPQSAIIMSPSTSGAALQKIMRKNGHPYGLEVLADPYDVLAPGAMQHPLRPIFRQILPRQLRADCKRAEAVLYVTKEALQKRYPCPNYSVGVSDVVLPCHAVLETPRIYNDRQTQFELVMIGALEQLYKGPHIAIAAIALCTQKGLDLSLRIIGDGKHRPELEQQAANLGIRERVEFLGKLPAGDRIFAELDRADLFLMPSFQEGLPRAMVEAMARAKPCVATSVGGIPELLPPEDLVMPGDAVALADKIQAVVTHPERMSQMSARNLRTAQDYTEEKLRQQRNAFYQYIKEQTILWQHQQGII